MKHSYLYWLAVAATILIAAGCDENNNDEESPTNPQLKCQSEGSSIDTWKCDGNTLSKCVSGNWEISQTCEANTQCNAEKGSCEPNAAAECTDDTWKCDGNILSKCVSGNWEISQACAANTLCNTGTGACDPKEPECNEAEHIFADQCEADDVIHCGTHTNDCTMTSGWKRGLCIDKACVADECETGYHLASDQNERKVCEEDTHDACGSVSTKCGADEICTQGACKDKCQPGEVICDGSCINPMTSRNFCGADASCSSYIACSESEVCISGKCVLLSCGNENDSLCAGKDQNVCVDIHGSNPNHCGACGFVCADRETAKAAGCSQGQCIYTCNDNMLNCGSDTDPMCLPEEQLKSDPFHCGKCDTKCAPNEYCQSGQCVVSSCTNNACLYNHACINQNDHCGTQCLNCNTANLASAGICQDGTCIITSCVAGYHLTKAGVCEIDSAEACPNGNATGTVNCNALDAYTKAGICVGAKCRAAECQDNAHLKDGKCIADSTTKCGAAETDCTTIAGWQSGQCVNGTCVAATCASGYCLNPVSGLCTNEQSISACGIDGGSCLSCNPKQVCDTGECAAKLCEGNVCNQTKDSDETLVCKNDDTHCGSSCQNCNAFTNHATAGICSADGTCLVTACETEYHIYNNACEADSLTDCGAHDKQCNVANANNECINKACTFTCDTSYHTYNHACEANSLTDCGAHGTRCNVENAENSCTNGTCTFTCGANSHAYNNTCEADDESNCGTHSRNCFEIIPGYASGSCVEKECRANTCVDGYHLDSVTGHCVMDTNDCCGTSCTTCPSHHLCSKGVCKTNCEEPLSECNNECHNYANDINHCGGCDQACTTDKVKNSSDVSCSDSICKAISCQSGYHVYDGECEKDELENCGAHATVCNVENAENTCTNGECTFTCVTDYHTYDNACEADSTTNCGAHGTKCSVVNATNTCTNGECTFTCFDGYEEINNECYPEGDAPFISVWDVKSDSLSVQFPIQGITGTITIDWGDGTSDTISSGYEVFKHTYSTANLYTIKVTGTINNWSCSSSSGCANFLPYCTQLVKIQSYGNITFGIDTFCRATLLESLPTQSTPRFNNNKMVGVFYGASKFNQNINFWNTSNITYMQYVFAEASSFNQPLDNWDTSNVTVMERVFQSASSFNQPLDNWNTSNVTSMFGMFSGASRFNQSLNNWNTSNVKFMNNMFSGARVFNQPLDNWNTSNVTNMEAMFQGAVKFNQPLNSWNTSNVSSMGSMFYGALNFNQPLDKWDTSNVKDMRYMFQNASSFNETLDSWNTSNVTSMEGMFKGASKFNQPLNNWNTSNVTSMYSMFYDASNFNQPLNNWNTSNVRNMQFMFASALSFNQPLNDWDTSNVTNMGSMFSVANRFNQPLDNWDISVVTNMSRMFSSSGLQKENYCILFAGPYSSYWTDFISVLGRSYECP